MHQRHSEGSGTDEWSNSEGEARRRDHKHVHTHVHAHTHTRTHAHTHRHTRTAQVLLLLHTHLAKQHVAHEAHGFGEAVVGDLPRLFKVLRIARDFAQRTPQGSAAAAETPHDTKANSILGKGKKNETKQLNNWTTHTNTYRHTQTHRLTNTQTQTHIDTKTHRHRRRHRHTQTHTDTHRHRHTQTQTHTHTHTHTHKHTHLSGSTSMRALTMRSAVLSWLSSWWAAMTPSHSSSRSYSTSASR